MKQRIIAWILLIGFVLLLVNLIFIRWQVMLSLTVYVIIALLYVFFGMRKGES